jgi:hypothetical protein
MRCCDRPLRNARGDAGQAAVRRGVARRTAPFPLEIRFARLRVADDDVADREQRRAAHRVVDTLPEEVCQRHDLVVGERRTRLLALGRVAGLQERPQDTAACAALRSKFVTFALMMLGPVSDPRAWEPWQSMQWLAHSARPRSCAA